MSIGPVASASVLISPNLTGFQAALQTEVTAAVLAIKVPPITVPVLAVATAAKATTTATAAATGSAAAATAALAGTTAATTAAAASTASLAAATDLVAGATVQEAAAALAVTRALEAQRLAEERLTAAKTASASASRIQTLENKASIAAQATQVAQLRANAAAVPKTSAAAAVSTAAATPVALAQTAAATAAATASTEALAAASTVAAGSSAKEAAASLAVTRALERQRLAEVALTEAKLANASASRIEALSNRVSAASQATSIAQLRLAESTKEAAKGFSLLGKEGNITKGALIGVSRITPVTVFGLGLAGSAAIAIGLSLKAAVASASQFEKQLNTFAVVAQASAQEIAAVRKEAIGLGADASLAAQSAGDAATAITELAKAGLSVTDSLAAARGVLQLAGAAEINAAEAAKIVATELNAFGLAGSQAIQVVDLLASASIAAQGEITDFAAAFQQVAAVANQAGLTVQQTTAALVELAKAGIQGADAGTSLRTFLLRLIPTTKQASEFTRALGVTLDSSKTEGQQLADVIEQYRIALLRLNPIQRTNVLNQIFGQDAIRAASVLTSQNTGELNRQIDALNNNGVAAEINAAKAKGLSGAWSSLQSTLETAGIQIGTVASGPLEAILRKINELIIDLGTVTTAVEDLVSALANLKPVQLVIEVVATGWDTLPDFVKKAIGITALGVSAPGIGAEAAAVAGVTALIPTKTPLPVTPDLIAPGLVETFTKALKGKDAKAIKDAAAQVKASFTGADSVFGIAGFQKVVQSEQEQLFDKTFGKAARIASQKDGTFQKKIQALIDKAAGDGAGSSVPDLTIKLPQSLQRGLVEAQLSGSKQAEADADNAVVAFFRRRLDGIAKNTKKYVVVAGQLRDALSQRDGVLASIRSDVTAQQQKDQQILETSIANQRTRLENAADRAGNTGEAAQRLRAFYRKEAGDLRLTEAARLSYQSALDSATDAQRKAIVENAKAQIDLRNARLDLAIQKADLTPEQADNRRAINNKIKALQHDIDGIKAIKNKTVEQRKEIVDLQSQIVGLKGQLQGLTGATGGFTLSDLGQWAVDQFTQFGDNISKPGGILSGQDARAAFGKQILDNLGAKQLTQAEKQTALLEELVRNSKDPTWTRKMMDLPTDPNAGGYKYSSGYAARASRRAAASQFGAG